jgi:hypothetical protein
MPMVYVVDRLAEEVFVPVYFHGVQGCVSGVFWVRDVVGCGGCWSLRGSGCVEWSGR